MTQFERFAPILALFHLGLLLMAQAFGFQVLKSGSPITPELYGPYVYAIPALVWVSIQTVSSSAAFIGAVMGGRVGATLCALGAFASGTLYSGFAIMSLAAESGTLVASGSLFVTAPMSFATALIAGMHIFGGVRDAG
jgi:hypothetical protein